MKHTLSVLHSRLPRLAVVSMSYRLYWNTIITIVIQELGTLTWYWIITCSILVQHYEWTKSGCRCLLFTSFFVKRCCFEDEFCWWSCLSMKFCSQANKNSAVLAFLISMLLFSTTSIHIRTSTLWVFFMGDR